MAELAASGTTSHSTALRDVGLAWQPQTDEWQDALATLDTSDPAAVQRLVDRVPIWWHTIDLGRGIVTPGRGGSPERLRRIRMPDDLRGKSVLDIGAWDGVFSFEAEKRGAARVVAADVTMAPSFQLARRVLGSRVEFVEFDLRRPDDLPRDVGTFDVVFFLGVLYHLPEPFRALQKVGELTRELMILETDTYWNWEETPVAELVAGHHRWPELTPRDAVVQPGCNWWIPNRACVERLVYAAGFDHYTQVYGPPPPPGSWRRKLWRAGRLLPSWLRSRTGAGLDTHHRLIAHCRK